MKVVYRNFLVCFISFWVIAYLPESYEIILSSILGIQIDWQSVNQYRLNFNMLYDLTQTSLVLFLMKIYLDKYGWWPYFIVGFVLFSIQTYFINTYNIWQVYRSIEFARDFIQMLLTFLIFKKIEHIEYKLKILWLLFHLAIVINILIIWFSKFPIFHLHPRLEILISLQFFYITLIIVLMKYSTLLKLRLPVLESGNIYKIVRKPKNYFGFFYSLFINGATHAILLCTKDRLVHYHFSKKTSLITKTVIDESKDEMLNDYLIFDKAPVNNNSEHLLNSYIGKRYNFFFRNCVTFSNKILNTHKGK